MSQKVATLIKPEGRSRERLKHLILLAETMEGYRNLVKIVSKASTEGFNYKPRADHDLLRQYSKGALLPLVRVFKGKYLNIFCKIIWRGLAVLLSGILKPSVKIISFRNSKSRFT